MGVLTGLEPASVFKYFEEICEIPHGSGNTKMISDYLADFARERELRFIQDEANNIIIYKDASEGYESHDTVILQGHMDMVCEKEEGCNIDMEKEGLRLLLENGMITADGTTLGGDDGIAVAFMLAILDADDIPHPALECVITVDEEVGMLGADAMDMSAIKGRTMINLDSEDEGHLLISCAGGIAVTANIPFVCEPVSGEKLKLTVTGMIGGHSGVEIDKGRANADVLTGRLLYLLKKKDPTLRLVSIAGGLKDNAIPRKAEAVIVTENPGMIRTEVEKIAEIYAEEFRTTDPDVRVEVTEEETAGSAYAMDEASTSRVIAAIMVLPSGVARMSFEIEGLVETSLNLGILMTEDNGSAKGNVSATYLIRSNVNSEKYELRDKIECMMEQLGGSITTHGEYPAWEYRRESALRELMVEIFREQYKKEPIVEAMHAGVECGLFSGSLPGLDAVSIGPDLRDIHTPQETMSVESVQRTWKYVLEILKRL